MFSSTTAVLMSHFALLVVPPKSTFGAATALLPSAFLRNATWAFSSAVVRFRNAYSCGALEERLLVVGGRLVVEGGLQVLEGEGVVEDADVALAEFGRRAALARRPSRRRG